MTWKTAWKIVASAGGLLAILVVIAAIIGEPTEDLPRTEETRSKPAEKAEPAKPFVTGDAATLRGGQVACLTQEAYDEVRAAVASGDRRAVRYLVDENLCLITGPGLEVSVLDWGFTGWVKIRVYTDQGALVLWTSREALE